MTQPRNFKRTIDFIYNPDNQTKEELISSFVVRLKTFDRLFSDIRKSKMKSPEQHYLIEGKRGMGKTTLLLRMGYEIENDEALNSWLIPIVFNEEEYSIRRLYKLWERVAKLLEEKNNDFAGLYDEMDESFASYESPEEYEYGVFTLLKKRLETKGKKLILFIDNFGDIFSKFNTQEIQRLRTVLQSDTNFRIVGASSTVLEAFYDTKHPFFEFFKVVRLRGLDKEETNELLLKLGETYKQEEIKDILQNQQGRVEALRRLTGGVIRTIVLLFEIFIDKKQGSAFSDLEAILDRVTPLYKHRMDDLPAQQQEIVEAIAFAWDAINVSEISSKTRIVSKTVSAQLRQMEKNEIITKKLTNNKNHFYQISERFFNIWYLMRHGGKGDKRKVLWLVRFLEEWCDEGELVARAQKHIGFLKDDTYDVKGAYYFTEALASTRALPSDKQDELIKTTRDFLSKNKSEFVKYLSESDLELNEKAISFYEKNEFSHALKYFLKMKKKDMFRIGFCYHDLNNLSRAEEYYLRAFRNGAVIAIFNLGLLYQKDLKDFSKAEKYYLMAVELGNVHAMYNLGHFYQNELNDLSKAEKYYLKAEGQGDVRAMYNLGHLYQNELKDFSKAEKYYLKAIEQGDIRATYNIGNLYQSEFKDTSKAEKYYLEAFELGNMNALNALGHLYQHELKDFRKAKKYYLKGTERGDALAMNNLARLYEVEFNDIKKTIYYYLLAIEQRDKIALNNLAYIYYDLKINKEKALDFVEQSYKIENNDSARLTYSKNLLWNDKVIESTTIADEFLFDEKYFTDYLEFFSNYFFLLLAKKQYQYLYNYFTNPKAEELNIKEKLKPIWYALMYYMQDQYPNEYLRMGEELEETVKEIIAEVEQMRIDYA